MSVKRKWELSSDTVKRQCLDEIVIKVNESIDEEIGLLTAEDVLNIVSNHLGPDIYNKALGDFKDLLNSKVADLDVDLEMLRQGRQ